MSQDLGYPPSWGDADLLPAYGGAMANAAWQQLGVIGRANVGGFPCDIVHGRLGSRWGLGNGCTTNAAVRFALAFFEAIAIYLPVRCIEFSAIPPLFNFLLLLGPLCSHHPYISQICSTSPTCCFANYSSGSQERGIFIHICFVMLVRGLLHPFDPFGATISMDFA